MSNTLMNKGKTCICPNCGKEFWLFNVSAGYKMKILNKTVYFCGYTCQTEYSRKLEEAKINKKRLDL